MAQTTLFQTPTLSFGEVGQTHSTETPPNVMAIAKGVGEFQDTKILEREILIGTLNWTSASAGLLQSYDLYQLLTNAARNASILNQFTYMRAGVEVTIRINATQFYYGALMVSLFPTFVTGQRFDERAVLDPTIISAQVSNAVIKKMDYLYPEPWMIIADIQSGSTQAASVDLDVLCPLTVASASAAETVSVQVWARLTDVVLSNPAGTLTFAGMKKKRFLQTEMQSKSKKLPIIGQKGKEKDEQEVTNITEAQSSQGKLKITCTVEVELTPELLQYANESTMRILADMFVPPPVTRTDAQSSKGKIKQKAKKKEESSDEEEESDEMDIRIVLSRKFWFSMSRTEKRAFIMKMIHEAFPTPVILNIPDGKGRIEAQMKKGKLTVKVPKVGLDMSPVDGAVKSATGAIDSVTQSVVGTVGAGLGAVSNLLDAGLGLAGLFLDKPDTAEDQSIMIQEPWKDAFAADVPDSNCTYSIHKQRYLDPGISRMPQSKGMTVSDYARIPGICAGSSSYYATYSANAQTSQLQLIQLHPTGTTHKKPLDYAYINSGYWRGSIKVMIQFFTSSFITTRFVIQYFNGTQTGGFYPVDYTAGLSRVIDVKGDTIDTFTCPWLNDLWWSQTQDPYLQITTISDVVSTDNSASPKIYVVVWVAGGDDIQFAVPRIPADAEWGSTTPNKKEEETEAQCSIGSMFRETEFPPIGEGVELQTDNGLCLSDQLGAITDICKRYAPLISSTVSGTPAPYYGVSSETLDLWAGFGAGTHTAQYSSYWRFRHTYYGSWRQAFLFQSGGYRYRCVSVPAENLGYTFQTGSRSTFRSLGGISYNTPPDKVARITVPQASPWPYRYINDTSFGNSYMMIDVVPSAVPNASSVEYLAARDDIQFGYPILPIEITPCT